MRNPSTITTLLITLAFLVLPVQAQTVNPTGQHGVDLAATAPAQGAPPTGYNVYRETVSGTCAAALTSTGCSKLTTTAIAPPSNGTALKYTDGCPANPGTCSSPALTEGTTFFYVWTSLNSAVTPTVESTPSLEVKATIPFSNPVPPAPGNPSVTAVR